MLQRSQVSDEIICCVYCMRIVSATGSAEGPFCVTHLSESVWSSVFFQVLPVVVAALLQVNWETCPNVAPRANPCCQADTKTIIEPFQVKFLLCRFKHAQTARRQGNTILMVGLANFLVWSCLSKLYWVEKGVWCRSKVTTAMRATQKELDCGTHLRSHSIQAEVEKPGCSFWQSCVLDTVYFPGEIYCRHLWCTEMSLQWGCRRDTGCEERLPLELKSPSKLTKHSQSGNSWWGPSHVNLRIQLMHAYRMIVLIFLRFQIWSVSGLKTRWAQQARFAGIWAETAQRRTAPASATLWAFSFGDGCKYHWCWCKMCILLWVTGKSGWNQQLVF